MYAARNSGSQHVDLPVLAVAKSVDDNHVDAYDVVLIGEAVDEETPILRLRNVVVVV